MATEAVVAPPAGDTATQATGEIAANGLAATGSANDGSAALDEDTRKTVEAKGWKGVGDAAKSYNELFSKFNEVSGKALTVPGADAKAEDWDSFYGKLGRPAEPKAYEFALPKDLPADFPYDGESANQFKAWAHAAGLAPKQAQSVHDSFVKQQAAALQAHAAAQAERVGQSHDELVKAWGEKGSAGYAENLEFANRFIKNQGDAELLGEMKAAGLISPEGHVLSPKLAKAMAAAGKALYREGGGSLVTGDGAPGGPNPFDAKTFNITEQMKMYRSNPDLAKAHMRAAGKQPSDFGFT